MIDQNLEINKFYPTEDFEVYCLCPICVYKKNINNDINDIIDFSDIKNIDTNKIDLKEEIEIIKTNYFFAGGYDNRKRQGLIKLYKINKEKEIEYIQDIENENQVIQKLYSKRLNNWNNRYYETNYDYIFECFKGTISCIIQSKRTGNILATCYDGNVYYFSPPNIQYYLEKEDDYN